MAREHGSDGGGTLGFALSIVAVIAAAALLVVCLRQPPRGLCEPVLGAPHALFAAAQALVLVALTTLRRQGLAPAVLLAATVSWSCLAGWVLLTREGAGSIHGLRPIDLAYGLGGFVGIALLLHGGSVKLASSRGVGAVVLTVLAVGVSVGWMKVVDAVPAQRAWSSWATLTAVESALRARTAAGDAAPPAGLAEVWGGETPRDAWGHELVYETTGTSWRVASLGSDGAGGPVAVGPIRSFAGDLVITERGFTSWPESPCGADGEDPSDLPAERREGVIDLRGRN